MIPSPVRRSAWDALSAASVGLLLVLAMAAGDDAGTIWDELLQAEYGNRILAWFRSGFVDRSATTYEDLYLYGGLFEVIAQWVSMRSPLGLYETRHLLTALLAVAGVVISGATARRIAGPRAGFLAGAVLALTPAWIGHGLFNPKDIPFGTLAAAVVWASATIATGPLPVTWSDAVVAAITVGLALSVRPGGVFLGALPFFALLAAVVMRGRAPRTTVTRGRAGIVAVGAGRLAAMLPLAWLLMLVAWPWAQLGPFSRPVEAMLAASRFKWDGTMLFGGEMVRSTDLPFGYLPTWFAITTPELYAIAFLLGALAVARLGSVPPTPVTAGTLTVTFAVVAPLAAALLMRPVLYDGLRHFLFLFPPLAVLAGLSLDAFIRSNVRPAVHLTGVGLFVVASVVTARDIVVLHPHQYVYFNRIFGGTAAAVGRYETDYWGASYREGLAWTLAHVSRLRTDGPTRVASCNDNSNRRLDYYRKRWRGGERIAIVPDYASADVFLAVTRYDCHKQPGQVLHIVERAGAPLLYVIRTGQQ